MKLLIVVSLFRSHLITLLVLLAFVFTSEQFKPRNNASASYFGSTRFESLLRKCSSPSVLLRRIFEPKMDELIGGWIKLHDEELHNAYS
jgi:hypothetical protein